MPDEFRSRKPRKSIPWRSLRNVPPQLVMLLRQYANDIDSVGMEACSGGREEIVSTMREAAELIERRT